MQKAFLAIAQENSCTTN